MRNIEIKASLSNFFEGGPGYESPRPITNSDGSKS